jgi:hypothetical protein
MGSGITKVLNPLWLIADNNQLWDEGPVHISDAGYMKLQTPWKQWPKTYSRSAAAGASLP